MTQLSSFHHRSRTTQATLIAIAALGACLSLSVRCRSAWSDEPAQTAAPPHAFIGTSTCSTSSCHGNADSRDPQVWKRSYSLWAQHDRHRRAFEVLFAPRSAEIVDRLAATARREPDDSQDSTPSEDADFYLRLLETRCIGCHATPPPNSRATSVAPPARRLAKEYADGVSCESCHGAAETWSSAHYAVDWKELPAKDKLERFGFAPTKPLAARPAVCVGCHVGPIESGGRSYEVDHDLIAAGHPRLDFEFSSALANLPPHWDSAQDQERHRRETGSTSFHFDAWKHGQLHTARSHLKLGAGDPTLRRQRPLDLARHDCFACHHQFRGDGARPGLSRAPGDGALRESLHFYNGALAIYSAQASIDKLPPAAQLDPFGEPLRKWLDEATRPSSELLNDVEPHRVLGQLASLLEPAEARSWDATVGFDLALRAWLVDVDPDATSTLATEVHILDDWLERSFGVDVPNRYHSPARFRPADPALTELLKRLQQGVTQMRTTR